MKLAIDPMVVIKRGNIAVVEADYAEYSIEKYFIAVKVDGALPDYYYRLSYFAPATNTWAFQRVEKNNTGNYEVASGSIEAIVTQGTGLCELKFELNKGEVLYLYIDTKDWVSTLYSSSLPTSSGGRHVFNPAYYSTELSSIQKRIDLLDRYATRLIPASFKKEPNYTATCVYAVLLDELGKPIPDIRPVAYRYTDVFQPASMAKVMTAIVAYELSSIDTMITILEEDIVAGSGNNLVAGRTLSLHDALYNLMLPSSNTTANAIARVTAGSVEDFVVKMNEKALALGCSVTSFGNASGLSHTDNKTNCVDMAIIASHYRKIPFLNTVWQTDKYSFTHTLPDGSDPQVLDIETTFSLVGDKSFEGHKTGTLSSFTNLVTFVRLPYDHIYAVVIMGGDGDVGRTNATLDVVNTLYQKMNYVSDRKTTHMKLSV